MPGVVLFFTSSFGCISNIDEAGSIQRCYAPLFFNSAQIPKRMQKSEIKYLVHLFYNALLTKTNSFSCFFLSFQWMRDKTADFRVRQNSRFWKRDKIADFDNETKPPILKLDKTADLL